MFRTRRQLDPLPVRLAPSDSGALLPTPYLAKPHSPSPHIFASTTAWLQAPSGFLVITGASPPEASSVATVRS
jgi:hypothetical protein